MEQCKMKRFLTTAAIALSMTTAAQAANHTIMFAGNYWRVTHMACNNDGNPMCMMHSQTTFGDGSVGVVEIKWVKAYPFINLSKTNWHFSPDLQVPFTVTLDSGSRIFVGVSKNAATVPNTMLFANVVSDEGSGWLEAFASSGTMTITFHNGNEPKWSIKMAGSRNAAQSFRSCIKLLDENGAPAPQATSPVDDPDASSQPAPSKPVPTAPIKKPKGDSI
jgi:hypothetical protein